MRVAIVIPHMGTVSTRFAECLAALTGHTCSLTIDYNGRPERAELALFTERDGPLDFKRTNGARRALAWEAEYLLFLDSDHVFPADGLVRLMMRDVPVVGCNYPTRTARVPTAYGFAKEPIPTTAAKAEAREIEAVAGIGLGFCLIKAPVFEAIGHPWFRTTIGEQGELVCGEDAHFCNQVRAARIPVLVDHGLSWEIGHIGEQIVTNADSAAG